MSLTDRPVLRPVNAPDQPDLPLATSGPIAIIAPHPDDETLGCGGLMAYCGRLHVPLTVVAMTDGEASHPGSRRTSPAQLIGCRAEERAQALAVLGAQSARVERFHLPDGGMRELDSAAGARCVRELVSILRRDRIQTLFVTASDDDHPDHRASYALAQLALQQVSSVRALTYAVWPPLGAIAAGQRWSLDIQVVQWLKRRAIACFASQRGEVVTDDPSGFAMPEALLARSLASQELYYPC